MKRFKGKIELLTERFVSEQENGLEYGFDGGGAFNWTVGVWRVSPSASNPERYILSQVASTDGISWYIQ